MNKLHALARFAAVFALGFTTALAAEPKPTSEFTTTDPKKVKILSDSSQDKEAVMDSFQHLCPGLGGYQVIHEGGDLRSWINLKINGKTTDLMTDTMAACPAQFPAKANDVVQWRGLRKGKSFLPYAIIYRMKSTTDDQPQKRFETLIIIKLDGENSKVVAHVSGKEGNEKAEAVADKLCRP